MMQCSLCKEFFNQANLQEVFEHEHEGFELNKPHYGKQIEEDK